MNAPTCIVHPWAYTPCIVCQAERERDARKAGSSPSPEGSPGAAPPSENMVEATQAGAIWPPSSVARSLLDKREEFYGDPAWGYRCLSLAWKALVEEHFGIDLGEWPPHLTTAMLVALKNQRGVKPTRFLRDTYDDLAAYNDMSEHLRRTHED